MSGVVDVVLEESQPKKVGCVFRPRLTKLFWSGTAGNEVPLLMSSKLRW